MTGVEDQNRPEIFIQTDDYDLILTSSPERNLTVRTKKENPNNEERLRFSSVIDEICNFQKINF